MRFGSSVLLGSTLLAVGGHAFAQGETRTLWYDVPNTASYPNSTPPTFPPSNAALAGLNASWDTYDPTTMTPRNVDTSLSAGLRVPNLGQLFNDMNVSILSQGNLTQISLTVVAYSRTISPSPTRPVRSNLGLGHPSQPIWTSPISSVLPLPIPLSIPLERWEAEPLLEFSKRPPCLASPSPRVSGKRSAPRTRG